MNKVLVNVFVPVLNTSYDMFIPLSSPVHEVLLLISRAVEELSDGRFLPEKNTALCRRKDGSILDINRFVYESDIQNGTKLMLI